MSFFDKLGDSKVKILLGLGGVALLGTIGYLYNNYKSQQETSQQHQQQAEEKQQSLDEQIRKLKLQINLDNPSFEDVKKILAFSLQASKRQIFKFSKNFKKDRKKFNKEKRNQNLDQYLRLISQGIMQIQQLGMVLQQEVLTKIGINETHFAKYQRQLGPFLQQQMMSQGIGSQSEKQLTLEQVKKAINLQIDYMQNQGQQMVQKLINTCSGWTQQQKSMVPTLISVYIADQVFEQHPQIDQEQLQGAQMKFQHQLQNQMYRLQEVMAPLMTQLTQGLGFGGYGMGGMGGMDMGMGQGPTMEQLQQLRMQDPQAFQQLMYMMQQGMQ